MCKDSSPEEDLTLANTEEVSIQLQSLNLPKRGTEIINVSVLGLFFDSWIKAGCNSRFVGFDFKSGWRNSHVYRHIIYLHLSY